ncbi:DUF2846 domain-containing protein [Nitrosomonas sp. Nm58]|uniref:DUF2846 domain-containing protein n=1 Tax=Nitrosomonas sp. Nm58 TaxID=200126 RepID=UPI000896D7E6|nr:DUF2846 domain-containing protein [Nitrosomonas sp. Nm58]SDZ02412.1 Protein of unknown function [Nitrosomonas sp. Nm58]
MNCIRLLTSALLALLILGCASVQLAPHSQDIEAKKFISVPDKSVVYVIQTGGLGSYRIFLHIWLNGENVATLSGNTYSRLVVDPGKYRLVATSPENRESVDFTINAGEMVFLGAGSKPGVAQMRVRPISKFSLQEGREAVIKRKLAESIAPL